MKDGVYIINYARGQVVDNDAICDALDSKKVAGFATDFPTPRQMKRACIPLLTNATATSSVTHFGWCRE